MGNRPAFTLVETLVALVIFQFAMLALASAAAVAAREITSARRMTGALAVARNRVEWLASHACPGMSGGTSTTEGFTEYWRVHQAGNLRIVSDSVVFPRPDGTSGVAVVRTAKLCYP